MIMIRFLCECGQQQEVADEHAGRKARCPKCEKVNVVPGSSTIQAEPSPAAQPGEVTTTRSGSREDESPALPTRSGKATASLALGIVSCFCLGSVLTGIPGLILGILALGD